MPQRRIPFQVALAYAMRKNAELMRRLARGPREGRVMDALAEDAIREYQAGRTRNIREFADEHDISLP